MPVQRENAGAEEFMRGTVRSEGDRFYLVPCFSKEQRELRSSSALKARYLEHTPAPGLPIYMELMGAPQSDLSWQVSKVMLAGDTVNACDRALRHVHYRAQGWSPRWLADIGEEQITVSYPKERKTLKFPIDQLDGIQLEWDSRMAGADASHSLQLSLLSQGCTDEQGIWSPWRATMTLDGEVFSGCARAGDVSQRALQGRYSNELDDAMTFVVMDLLPDSRVQMLLDYRNGEPLSVMKGRWELKGNGRLHLFFSERDQQPEQAILILKRGRSGQFVQAGYSDIFGRDSLRLSRSE
ncbi:hypothetical protein [Neptunomonas marina]|uniref:Uncharacterized protein n=1 Tax=Neptunomonas marina TaxID=1815562 RepID=A0A437QDE5_9GAMM|nr:hypothetical protein [Neptunomonas marina]RVU32459.1 hypothetical protein EOE65_02080 [Neptunomonas marina]